MASLLHLVESLARDPQAKAEYQSDPDGYLAQRGHGELQPEDVSEALTHAADTFPPQLAAAVSPDAGLDSVAAVELDELGLDDVDDFSTPFVEAEPGQFDDLDDRAELDDQGDLDSRGALDDGDAGPEHTGQEHTDTDGDTQPDDTQPGDTVPDAGHDAQPSDAAPASPGPFGRDVDFDFDAPAAPAQGPSAGPDAAAATTTGASDLAETAEAVEIPAISEPVGTPPEAGAPLAEQTPVIDDGLDGDAAPEADDLATILAGPAADFDDPFADAGGDTDYQPWYQDGEEQPPFAQDDGDLLDDADDDLGHDFDHLH